MRFWQLTDDSKVLKVWVVLVLILFAAVEYGNWQRGAEVDKLCTLTGPHDGITAHPMNPKEEIDNICISRRPE